MANELDELDESLINHEGRDVHVIEKQIPVKVGAGSLVFEIVLWCLAIIPGLIFLGLKMKAKNYLRGLQQKIQHNASQIDNYIEQRVVILQNAAALVNKAVALDKDTFTEIARLRAGTPSANADVARNELNSAIENVNSKINVAMENYPELKAHSEIAQAMQQNSYLQREITAAREVYNDTVQQWNMAIYDWPCKCMVAHKRGYTTRIPFTASKEVKEKARGVFF